MPKDRFGIVDEYVSGCVGPGLSSSIQSCAYASEDGGMGDKRL
jgi:hypothetical protein